MKMTTHQCFTAISAFFLASIMSLSLPADDTEIYFSEATGDADAKPNIVFILDNSGSMSYDADGTSPTGHRPGTIPDYQGDSRMTILKDTFSRVINSSTDINVGLIRLNRTGNDTGGVYQSLIDVDGSTTQPIAGTGYSDEIGTGISQQSNNKQQGSPNPSPAFSLTKSLFGLRFINVEIPQGATISSAHIELTAGYAYDGYCYTGDFYSGNNSTGKDETNSPAVNLNISIHDSDNSPNLNLNSSNQTISGLSASWSLDNTWRNGQRYESSNLSNLIQAVVNKNGWLYNNSLTLYLTPDVINANSKKRFCTRRGGGVTRAPYLVVNYTVQGETVTVSNRVKLRSLVDDLSSSGGTPTIPRLLTAANYFENSTGVITNTCQSNHIVLLSDGEPTVLDSTTANAIHAKAGGDNCNVNMAINNNNSYLTDDTYCGEDLADWLSTTDIKPNDTLGVNSVNVHTIGFASSSEANGFLEAVATKGQGIYRAAADAEALASAFNDIFKLIESKDSTFVTPGATVNQFNRLEHKNELYYALFKPVLTDDWPGNIKRYRIGKKTIDDEARLVIADYSTTPKVAIDPATGFFKSDARSAWLGTNDGDDGNETKEGGVAHNLPATTGRNIYTDVSDNDLSEDDNKLITTNAAITPQVLGVPDNFKDAVINWARGQNSSGGHRKAIGDPLHSEPALATYGCIGDAYVETNKPESGCANGQDLLLFSGTNHGYLHAFSTATGTEKFAYIPGDLLPRLNSYRVNGPTPDSGRTYGLDGSPYIWRKDENNNGVIETAGDDNDHVYVYIGMRRGGRNYYAIDATNPDAPVKLWQIDGGTNTSISTTSKGAGNFTKLAQTWSRPVRTKVKIGTGNNSVKDVLIFSGGYNATVQDDADTKTADTIGNAIYMVDAVTGNLIWWASKTGANLNLPKMDYSIPSELKLIDFNLDGFADQMFVGDTGGQVWRFFFDHGNSVNNLIKVAGTGNNQGVFARIAGQNSSNHRRFYNKPSVATTIENGTSVLAVAIGSGFQAGPKKAGVQDRFYVFKTVDVNKRDTSYTPLTHATGTSLYNASGNIYGSPTAGETAKKEALAGLTLNSKYEDSKLLSDSTDKHGGFYINLPETNEKTLSSATIFNSDVSFSTYQPLAPNSCSVVSGTNRIYNMSINDGTGKAAENSRSITVNNTGIINGTTYLYLDPADIVDLDPDPGEGEGEEGGNGSGNGGGNTNASLPNCPKIIVAIQGTNVSLLNCPDASRKTYWLDEKIQLTPASSDDSDDS